MNIVEFLEGEIIRDEMRDVMYQPHDESCDYPGDEPGVCTCFRNAVEVEAKRQILALHKMSKSKLFATGKTRPGFCETCAFGQSCDCCFDYDDENLQSLAPCPTLRILASVYRDRPGWQEEWAS